MCPCFFIPMDLTTPRRERIGSNYSKQRRSVWRASRIEVFQTDLRIFSYGEMDNPVEKERALKYHTFQCLVKIMLRENQLLMLESHKKQRKNGKYRRIIFLFLSLEMLRRPAATKVI